MRTEILSLSNIEKLYGMNDLERVRSIANQRERARAAHCIRDYNEMLTAYKKNVSTLTVHIYELATNFTNQPLQLNSGDWQANDDGVTGNVDTQEMCACPHPIMPVERQIDADTGTEKVVLAYKETGSSIWKKCAFDRAIVSNSRTIVSSLASVGIAVTSETAKYLVKYIYDTLRLNDIPCIKSVSRLGWVSGAFLPYFDRSVKYSGDIAYESTFKAIMEAGNFNVWKDTVLEARDRSVTTRAVLNASFASPLLELMGKPLFFLHIWGPSGTGKTVALMMAMSPWGNPDAGALVKSFSGTNVGLERLAAFFNSIPLALDELQTRGEQRRKDNDIVYMLSGGQGKPRGTKAGGIEQLPTWRNCILTTGEQPLLEDGAMGGAINRILNFYQSEPLFQNAPTIANTVKANYGYAGRMFIAGISRPEAKIQMQQLYDEFYQRILSGSLSTEKQAMAAAMLALGEYFSNLYVFGMAEKEAYTTAQVFSDVMINHVVSAKDVDDISKAYDWILGWAAANGSRFDMSNSNYGECWGELDSNGGYYIIAQVLQKALTDAGMSCRKILQGLSECNKIEVREEAGKARYSLKHTLKSVNPRCIHLLKETSNEEIRIDELI